MNKEQFNVLMIFLNRVDLKGSEVPSFIDAVNAFRTLVTKSIENDGMASKPTKPVRKKVNDGKPGE